MTTVPDHHTLIIGAGFSGIGTAIRLDAAGLPANGTDRSSGRTVVHGPTVFYFDANGDVPLRSSTTLAADWRSRRFDLDDYAFTRQQV